MDTILTQKFTRFLMQRADKFIILRRKAVKGYNISFLVTNSHLEYLVKAKLIDFIIKFMEDVDKVCIIQSVGFSLLQTPVVTTRRKSAT